jgi:hypothetical protein
LSRGCAPRGARRVRRRGCTTRDQRIRAELHAELGKWFADAPILGADSKLLGRVSRSSLTDLAALRFYPVMPDEAKSLSGGWPALVHDGVRRGSLITSRSWASSG